MGLVTCAALPHGDDDEELLVRELEALGIETEWLVWTDVRPEDISSEVNAVVIRSPWDYPEHRESFMRWLEALTVSLFNPPAIARWNSDKRYLLDLAGAGVPTVETTVIEDSTSSWTPPKDFAEFVVKPAVGAGSIGIGRFREDELSLAQTRVEEIHRTGRAALVQPYLPSVDHGSETALIFVVGCFSHAVSKGPMLRRDESVELVAGLYVAEEIGSRVPTAQQLTIAQQALDTIPEFTQGEVPLYARVDLVNDVLGHPVLLELELIEPSLFFRHRRESAEVFAKAISERI